MKQIVTKGGQVFCTTTTPYSKDVIKQLKKAGYKVTEERK